jgi:cytoskeletal protein CcmA (bactofilin family)
MNIGASVVIKGNITASEDFSVAGRVEGEIRLHAGTLTIAPGSFVIGDASAPSVAVSGSVDGSVTATQRVEVRPGASVMGSITTPSLLVAEGALLNCRIEMPKAAQPKAAPAATVQPAPAPKVAVSA